MHLPPSTKEVGNKIFQLIKDNVRLTVGLVAVLAIVVSATYFTYAQRACAITLDGKTIAVAETYSLAQEVIDELIATRSDELQVPVVIDGDIELEDASSTARPLDREQLINQLEKHLGYVTEGAAILVNGEMKFALRDTDTAEELLNRIKEFYSKGENCRVEIIDNVEIAQAEITPNDLVDLETALLMVDKGVKEIHSYTMQEGDTLWDIAAANKISIDELQDANAGLNPDTMQIGQEISLTKTAPLIQVAATYNNETEETISPPVERQNDYNVYVGLNKILKQGAPGLKKVIYQITERNGVEVERTTVQEQIIKEPEKQVVAVGAKVLIASRGNGSGRLAWPVSGQVSSQYGMRSGRMHSGIDICNSSGTPIGAAAGGKVVKSEWYYNYGITVDIDHGNGLLTRYAHLNSAAVQYGQEVTTGQLIGRMGTTGNAQGSHLHFEVRVNGAHKNPMNYLN